MRQRIFLTILTLWAFLSMGVAQADTNSEALNRIPLNSPDSAALSVIENKSLSQDRADVYITGTIRNIRGTAPDYRITVRTLGYDHEILCNHSTQFQGGALRILLQEQSRISVTGILQDRGKILARSISGRTDSKKSSCEGTIEKVDYGFRTVIIGDSKGSSFSYRIFDTEIFNKWQMLELRDLQPGDRVRVTYEDPPFGSTDLPKAKYIQVISGSQKIASGIVTRINYSSKNLWIRDAAREMQVNAREARIIWRYGDVNFNDIQEGDRVTVYGNRLGGIIRATQIEISHIVYDDRFNNKEKSGFTTTLEGKISYVDRTKGTIRIIKTGSILVQFTIYTDVKTVFRKNSRFIRLSDLKSGDQIRAEGNLRDANSLDAKGVTFLK